MEFVESDAECLGEFQLREKVNSHKKFKGKLKRFLKTDPLFAKHAFFATVVSCQQVARTPVKTLQAKRFEQIC